MEMQDVAFLQQCNDTFYLLKQLQSEASQKPLQQANLPPTAISRDLYKRLAAVTTSIRELTSLPEANNSSSIKHLQIVTCELKTTKETFSTIEDRFRDELRATAERECLIVNPNATDEQIKAAKEIAVAYPHTPIFQQALLTPVRRDKASSVAHEVEQRHKEIQDIEKQTEMITELFESVDQIVSQQARVVLDIEEKSEEVKGDTVKATMECGKAIKSARSRNRKKCWCALIVMLIITSIIIVAVIVVTQKAKRA